MVLASHPVQGPALAALALLAASCLVTPGASSHAFLAHPPTPVLEVSGAELQADLQRELQEAFNGSRPIDERRLEATERILAPMFATLPKNAHGNLEHAAVRYALHRYFVQQHGWSIKGLEPAGGGWNGSSAATVMQDRVPGYVQDLFEHRMGGCGLTLREMAVLASTLEHLVHQETVDWLAAAYRATGVPTTGRASEKQVAEAIELYMAIIIVGMDLPSLSPKEAMKEYASIESTYPTWKDTQLWLEDVRHSAEYTHRFEENPFVGGAMTFESAGRVVDDINDQYGRWQSAECLVMKNKLLSLEDTRGSGRVSLASFYGGAATDEEWQFSESVGYLRQLGALDETVPGRPQVIVPNYVTGPNNCVASTGLHSVCCVDECEALLGELEKGIMAPSAPPHQVASIVSRIPSSTVDAPRNLTATLLGKLEEVASHHGGRVPLHGRLFGQWMHHAFPNECPYPHISGSTAPRTPDEWMQQTRQDVMASKEERAQHREAGAARPEAKEVEEPLLQWSMEEELVAAHHDGTSTDCEDGRGLPWRQTMGAAASVLLLGAFLSIAAGGLRTAQAALPGASAKDAARVPLKISV